MSSEKTNRRRWLNTIGARLTLWGAGITIAVCLLVCVILYVGLSVSLFHEVDSILEGEVQELTASVFKEYGQDYPVAQRNINLELAHRLRGDLSFRLLDEGGQALVSSDPRGWLAGVPIPAADESGSSGFRFETVALPGDHTVRVCSWPFTDPGGRRFMAQSGYLLDEVVNSLTILRWVCIAALLAASAAALVGGRMIAGRGLRPIQAMINQANRISANELDERLPTAGTDDELDHLAETLNAMLNRIERYVAQLKQFVADASHELRSPLAALRGNAEVVLSAARSEDELREVIQESIDQYDRLSRIAEDLLLLARAEAGELSLERKAIRLDQAVSDVIELYRPLAEDEGVELRYAASDAVRVHADDARMRQLVGNLLDNAIKYSGRGSRVSVATAAESGIAEMTVADNGPGISQDHLARIFDRFYRVDRSRSRGKTTGAGLGLAICRMIVEAHGGRIQIASTPGEGTCVTVTMPQEAAGDETSGEARPTSVGLAPSD